MASVKSLLPAFSETGGITFAGVKTEGENNPGMAPGFIESSEIITRKNKPMPITHTEGIAMRTAGRMIFAVLCLAATAGSASAQLSFSGGPQIGVAFSSFQNNVYGTGLLFGGHGNLDLNKNISLRLSFDYVTFGADNGKLKSSAQDQAVQSAQTVIGRALTADETNTVRSAVTAASGARASAPAVYVSAIGKLPTSSIVTPYAILGFGMTFLSFGDVSVTGDGTGVTATDAQGQDHQIVPAGTASSSIPSQTKFGLQFGAGGEVKVSKLIKIFLEVHYNMIFTEGGNSNYIPIMVGATFGG